MVVEWPGLQAAVIGLEKNQKTLTGVPERWERWGRPRESGEGSPPSARRRELDSF